MPCPSTAHVCSTLDGRLTTNGPGGLPILGGPQPPPEAAPPPSPTISTTTTTISTEEISVPDNLNAKRLSLLRTIFSGFLLVALGKNHHLELSPNLYLHDLQVQRLGHQEEYIMGLCQIAVGVLKFYQDLFIPLLARG